MISHPDLSASNRLCPSKPSRWLISDQMISQTPETRNTVVCWTVSFNWLEKAGSDMRSLPLTHL